ncbi:hypothetical protein IID20_05255 [Patescibacteria group bacterium]|nr:hypothetical protein [Patescibacteria group bacterium]
MAPGQVFLDQKNTPAVMSSQGAISLILVQPEGKPEMSGVEFLNGHQELVGQILN